MTPSSGSGTVLYLDAESGRGGSSRSLYYLIQALDRRKWHPLVLTRSDGPFVDRYGALGVDRIVSPTLPALRLGERHNWLGFALFCWDVLRSILHGRTILRSLRDRGVSLIHANYEATATTAWMLSRYLGVPWVCHVRTRLPESFWSRTLYRLMHRSAESIIFITSQEQEHFEKLVGERGAARKGKVVHNAAPRMPSSPKPLDALTTSDDSLRVVSLASFAPNRGVDRIIDVAVSLRRRGRGDIVFFLCGRLPARTGRLWQSTSYAERMLDRVRACGLQDIVHFPGYIEEPERALASSHVLLQLRRRANPWGRDVIEAMRAGVPVVTTGSYQGFIEDGVNGFIDPEFDPERVADHLEMLSDRPELRHRMGAASRAKAEELFDPAARAAEVMDVYHAVLGRR